MTAAPTAVLFDLDGTLVDSNYLHTIAWARALREADEWAPMNAIHRSIGMGADILLPALIGRTDDDIAARSNVLYRELIGEVHAFPEAAALVHDLATAGVRVVLATSAPAQDVATLVALLGIGPDLYATTTIDDVQRSKPDPEIFLVALERSGCDAADVVVVGDTNWDVEAATAARVPCVAVESGGFGRAELEAAGALTVYEDVAALRADLRLGPLARLLG